MKTRVLAPLLLTLVFAGCGGGGDSGQGDVTREQPLAANPTNAPALAAASQVAANVRAELRRHRGHRLRYQ